MAHALRGPRVPHRIDQEEYHDGSSNGSNRPLGLLGLAAAVWARAELILIWVGFMALFRGFGQTTLAFAVRKAEA